MSVAASAEKKYRFTRADFGPLECQPLHLHLTFDIIESRVIVTNQTTFVYKAATESAPPLTTVRLNSNALQIVSVHRITRFEPLRQANSGSDFAAHVQSFANDVVAPYTADDDAHMLNVTLDHPVSDGEEFVLRFVSVATPTDHTLEGIYYDFTPPQCPRTMISQCQQYGFQRITPCMDYMTAKAYYTTNIIADKRYTNKITNGDLAPGFVTAGGQVVAHPPPVAPSDVDDPQSRELVCYHNHVTNMAPYLFFIGVGTYVTHRRILEYPDGDTCWLELLVFPDLVEDVHARTAINALHDSVMWVYLSTGPEASLHEEARAELYKLIAERETLRDDATSTRLAAIRQRCKDLIGVWSKTGYKYTGAIYREIAMQNSDYGGMENVGNTTIISSRMVPSALQTDPGIIYMEGVKVHEFYHNINGSEVTGQSPFEIWLNEAVTVHIQRQREDALFGADFMRLREVVYAFTPAQGPLAVDRSANSMAIEPVGFNRTQELISAMTYSKAPEFVLMVQTLMGKAVFDKALDMYHTRYKYSNATTSQWIDCMEEVSGLELHEMSKGWLKRTGYPTVHYSSSYDAGAQTYSVHMKQSGYTDGVPFDMPIVYALVKDGKNIADGLYRFCRQTDTLVVSNVSAKPDFISFARNWSFYGNTINETATADTLRLQALSDSDTINRYFAYRAFVEQTKAALIEYFVANNAGAKTATQSANLSVQPPSLAAYADLHGVILFDESITLSTRAMMLREAEDINSRPDLAHHYWPLYYAKVALLQAAYDAHADKVIALYKTLEARNKAAPHIDGIHDRALKAHLYNLMSYGTHTPSALPLRQIPPAKADLTVFAANLIKSPFMSDRVFGVHQFISGPAPFDDRAKVQLDILTEFSKHPDSTEVYIGIIAGLDSDESVSQIRQLIRDTALFKIALAGHARAVARAWSMNRKRSLLTTNGLSLTVELFTSIGKVNQMSAQSILQAFNDLPKFQGETKAQLLEALNSMRNGVDKVRQESLYNQLTTIINS